VDLRCREDALEILSEAGERDRDVHLCNSPDRVWPEELADGDFDYRAVAAELKKTGYEPRLSVELAGTRRRRSRLRWGRTCDVGGSTRRECSAGTDKSARGVEGGCRQKLPRKSSSLKAASTDNPSIVNVFAADSSSLCCDILEFRTPNLHIETKVAPKDLSGRFPEFSTKVNPYLQAVFRKVVDQRLAIRP
jgi:hypothetical protein